MNDFIDELDDEYVARMELGLVLLRLMQCDPGNKPYNIGETTDKIDGLIAEWDRQQDALEVGR